MSTKAITLVLKISCFFIFIGRGYQHLFWDAPYRSFLWDQNLLEPIVNDVFHTPWHVYVSSLKADTLIQQFIIATGVLYVLCAFIALFINQKSNSWLRSIILLGGINLVLLSILITKEKFYHTAMFFEHSIQFSVPFILLYFLKKPNITQLTQILKAIIAIAFICHGLYAIGALYPIPGNFVTMTLNILPVSESTAKQLLFVMGILDFIVALCLYIPKCAKSALAYAFIWGILTAFARIFSALTYDVSVDIFHQYFYLTLYRIPHGLVPLLTLLIITNIKSKVTYTKAEDILFV